MKHLLVILGGAAVALCSSRVNSDQLTHKEIFKAPIILASAIPDETSFSFRVIKATLRCTPSEYMGPCPAEIRFNAKISVTGKGTVVFQVLRSDNATAPSVTMAFEKSGTKDTTYFWRPKENFLGWHQLKITTPNEIESNQVEVAVQCQ